MVAKNLKKKIQISVSFFLPSNLVDINQDYYKQNTKMREENDLIFDSSDESYGIKPMNNFQRSNFDMLNTPCIENYNSQNSYTLTDFHFNISQKSALKKDLLVQASALISTSIQDITQQEYEEQDDQYEPKNLNKNKVKKKEKKAKQRVSNQNLCKKYHTIADNCLKQIGIDKHLPERYNKKHKKNYFVLVLELAKALGKYEQFSNLYCQKISSKALKMKQKISTLFHGSKQYKDYKQLLHALSNSLSAIKFFKQGEIRKAVEILFDVKNIKRPACIYEAMEEAQKFGEILHLK